MPLDCKESPPRKLTAASYFKLGLNGGYVIIVVLGIFYICLSKLINSHNHFNYNWIIGIVFLGVLFFFIERFSSFRRFFYARLLKQGIATSGIVDEVIIFKPWWWWLTDWSYWPEFEPTIIYYSFRDESEQHHKSKILIDGNEISMGTIIPDKNTEITILYDSRNPKRSMPYRFSGLVVKDGKNWVLENRKASSIKTMLSSERKSTRRATILLLSLAGTLVLISIIAIIGAMFFYFYQR